MDTLPDQDIADPPHLRLLRRLVTALLVVMIFAVVTVVALLVIRLSTFQPTAGPVTDLVAPDGQKIEAVTYGQGWSALVTTDADGIQWFHIFNPDGAIRQSVEITP